MWASRAEATQSNRPSQPVLFHVGCIFGSTNLCLLPFAFKICLVLVTWSPLGNNRAQTSQWSWVADLNPEVFFEGGRD